MTPETERWEGDEGLSPKNQHTVCHSASLLACGEYTTRPRVSFVSAHQPASQTWKPKRQIMHIVSRYDTVASPKCQNANSSVVVKFVKLSCQFLLCVSHSQSLSSPHSLLRLLFLARLGDHIPMNRSSHSSSSWESNSTGSSCAASKPISTPLSLRFSEPEGPPDLLVTSCVTPVSQSMNCITLFVSKMNMPTLYLCDSSAALTYCQPSTEPQTAQLMSDTVCAPVTSWRGTGLCVCVLGRLLGLWCLGRLIGGVANPDEKPGGATRYALP